MIIEDEVIVAMELEGRLVAAGLEVIGCVGTHAEAMLLAARRAPDLVVADIRIGGPIDGLATAVELQARLGCAFIVLSASTDPATLRAAEAAGASGFVVKPFDDAEFTRAVARALAPRAART